MNKYFFFSLVTIIAALFSSCEGNNAKRDVKSAAISLVSNQEDIIGYGYVDVAAIIEKGDLTSIDPIGRTIESNFTKIASAFDTEENIYYALSGPLDKNGFPAKVIGLAKVNNKDSVQQVFTDMGYMFEEEKGKLVYYDMSTAIGITDDYVVFVTADFQGDPKKAMFEAFKNMNDKDQNDRVSAILSEESDILAATNLENLYATSNTSLNNLPKNKQKEIEDMVEDSHISTSIHFNNGNLTVAMNSSRVSEAMKNSYFFKDSGAENAAQAIGPGKPLIGLAAGLDIAKMEKFMNKFSPGAAKEFYRNLGLGGFFLQAMGSEGIASLINGDIGFNISEVNEKAMMGMGGNIPVFNAYVGFGDKGSDIKDLIHAYSEDGQVEDLKDGYYRIDQSIMHVSNKELVLHSNDSLKEQFQKQPITRMEGMNNFGEKPLFLFVDMDQVSKMELPMSSQAQALVELSKYGTIEGDNDGVTIKLVMKNSKENVLKQIVEETANQFKSQLSGMSL